MLFPGLGRAPGMQDFAAQSWHLEAHQKMRDGPRSSSSSAMCSEPPAPSGGASALQAPAQLCSSSPPLELEGLEQLSPEPCVHSLEPISQPLLATLCLAGAGPDGDRGQSSKRPTSAVLRHRLASLPPILKEGSSVFLPLPRECLKVPTCSKSGAGHSEPQIWRGTGSLGQWWSAQSSRPWTRGHSHKG